MLVTPMLTQAVLKELAAGASVLVTDERVAFPAQNAIFKLAGWKGDEKREFVHGNLFLEHPALTGFPHDGYGDLQAYELLNHRPVANLDKMPGHIRPIVWAIDVPWKMRRMAYLWEARVGRGKLLVSAFSLGKRNEKSVRRWPGCMRALDPLRLQFRFSAQGRAADRVAPGQGFGLRLA